ncbi:MAG TPA: DUF3108 domain-containing protein [Usitatibacter sp.]|nr:DUF3108 domain-containing protein [Usitatibacter sp.]
MKKLLALLAFVSTSALAIPSEITAEYQLTNRGITIGRVSETFVRKGDSYAISSVSRSEGILKALYDEQITLQSAGRVNAAGLQPLQFDERRTRESKRDVNATFDWERGVMHSRFRGEVSQHALPRETQDRISMMYQFMHLQPRSGNLVMSMSNGRKVEGYTYRVVDEVRLATPMGEFETLHLERVTSTPKESKVEVWLSKQHHNFPVRVVFDDPRGLRLEQTIVALQAR